MPEFVAQIDWTRPWFASVRAQAQQVLQFSDWREGLTILAGGIRNHRDLPLRFVPQEQLPMGVAYESYISQSGCVPTRDNLHDFLNGLVWLAFPQVKRQLNAFQAEQITQLGIGKSRGPARDVGTIFDENAALLVVRNQPEMQSWLAELHQHQWLAALWQQRERYQRDYEVWSFGHALMEKLVRPYKAITAHAKVLMVEADFFAMDFAGKRAHLDQLMAKTLLADGLTGIRYTPLPVLGIPGWQAGQDADFYADTQVFRPRRQP